MDGGRHRQPSMSPLPWRVTSLQAAAIVAFFTGGIGAVVMTQPATVVVTEVAMPSPTPLPSPTLRPALNGLQRPPVVPPVEPGPIRQPHVALTPRRVDRPRMPGSDRQRADRPQMGRIILASHAMRLRPAIPRPAVPHGGSVAGGSSAASAPAPAHRHAAAAGKPRPPARTSPPRLRPSVPPAMSATPPAETAPPTGSQSGFAPPITPANTGCPGSSEQDSRTHPWWDPDEWQATPQPDLPDDQQDADDALPRHSWRGMHASPPPWLDRLPERARSGHLHEWRHGSHRSSRRDTAWSARRRER